MNIRNFFEVMAESVYGMVEGAMGAHNAPRFFPLVGTLWLFILFGNLIGLVPGFISPNDTIKTNLALAPGTVFVTHVYGIKEHGLAYFKHFLGPTPALAPLMLPIELVSHIARPISLTLRLMGNMVADHKVVFSFFMLVPILVPVPFMLLGLLVCLVQAIVFCTLTMVYLSHGRGARGALSSGARSPPSFVDRPSSPAANHARYPALRASGHTRRKDMSHRSIKKLTSLFTFFAVTLHLGRRVRPGQRQGDGGRRQLRPDRDRRVVRPRHRRPRWRARSGPRCRHRPRRHRPQPGRGRQDPRPDDSRPRPDRVAGHLRAHRGLPPARQDLI
jgi:F-type H+-transporting ATPase subunit a